MLLLAVAEIQSTDAMHASDERRSVQALVDIYKVDETLAEPPPRLIGIVDDVLTVGTHFKAMQAVLSRRFPGVPIAGFFIARRVPEAIDLSELFS